VLYYSRLEISSGEQNVRIGCGIRHRRGMFSLRRGARGAAG